MPSARSVCSTATTSQPIHDSHFSADTTRLRAWCVYPFWFARLKRRFGVASFHNASDSILDEGKRDIIEVAVAAWVWRWMLPRQA